jgi:hypothetical protein
MTKTGQSLKKQTEACFLLQARLGNRREAGLVGSPEAIGLRRKSA